jgi:hypothetical protein
MKILSCFLVGILTTIFGTLAFLDGNYELGIANVIVHLIAFYFYIKESL